MRISLLLLLSLVLPPASGSAQASSPRPAASVLFDAGRRAATEFVRRDWARDTVQAQIRPTYWKEGALIGGGVGAVAGAVLGHGLCEMSEEAGKNCTGSLLLGSVLGAALVAIPGALIGGLFPKHQEAEASGS